MASVGIAGGPREQDGRAPGPAALETLVLFADGVFKLLVDRDKRFPVHLVVEVAQIRGSVGVADHAVARQTERVADAQPAAHQDDGDQAVIGGAPPDEVLGVVQLRHHVLTQRPGKPLPLLGEVLGKEHRVRRERAVPAMLADRGEKQVELTDHGPVHHPAGEFGVQAGQVTLEHRPVHLAKVVNVYHGVCEERREAGDRPGSRAGCRSPQAGAQPPPGPSLGQVLQPGLGDVLEADVS